MVNPEIHLILIRNPCIIIKTVAWQDGGQPMGERNQWPQHSMQGGGFVPV